MGPCIVSVGKVQGTGVACRIWYGLWSAEGEDVVWLTGLRVVPRRDTRSVVNVVPVARVKPHPVNLHAVADSDLVTQRKRGVAAEQLHLEQQLRVEVGRVRRALVRNS